MKKIIIILGMHRSGTSMVAQVCQRMGAYLGEENELMVATRDNPDGYFENREISCINDKLLHLCGREWYSLQALETDCNSYHMEKAVKELKLNIQKLLEKNDTVAIKEPRISILLPLWEKVLNELEIEVHYIWVFRNPFEVADSLRKRDGYSREHSLLLWEYYNLSILKYLKEKDYLLLNYADMLENVRHFDGLLQLFGKTFNDKLKQELERIVKPGYRHSRYSDAHAENECKGLHLEMHDALLRRKNLGEKISDWEKIYQAQLISGENKFIDYDILENIEILRKKRLIIYGAGHFGKQATEMLQELGFCIIGFCDKDIHKHGTKIMGKNVFSIAEIEEMENLCIIIALEKREWQKEVEQTLLYIKGVQILSFFALKAAWKYFKMKEDTLEFKIGAFSSWYEELEMRGKNIKNACKCPILIYQNGKVGSSTISHSLQVAGIENAHIHRFFFKNDIVGELLLGEGQEDFIKKTSKFQIQESEYVKSVKIKMKGKKIITMVRDPIAVDLSTIFQWIDIGISDRYFARELKQGKAFQQIVTELIIKIKDRLFHWFHEELEELYGIDVYAYPFDKEKGYTVITENDVKILLLKAEKLSQMTDVIRSFIGNEQIELMNTNIGKEKEYAHIYNAVKERLKLPKEYVEHYYKNNPYMDHFYTEQEKEQFFLKWLKEE